MKIVIDEITDIKPVIRRGALRIQLNAVLLPYQYEDLFYQIWEDLGDEELGRLIENENCKLTIK